MKTLGMIGGVGPMATAYFMQLIIEMTDARVDQEHIKMIIVNDPQIPDRTDYLLGRSSKNPYEDMLRIGGQLLANQADIIAMPCITASVFLDRLAGDLQTEVINPVRETCEYLERRRITSVGLLATDGTIKHGLFQKYLSEYGIRVHLPDAEGQQEIMKIIYEQIKAGKPVDIECFDSLSYDLRKKGAQVILLGCTVLSLIRRDGKLGGGYLDVMQVLAKVVVEQCGRLKPEYQELITD